MSWNPFQPAAGRRGFQRLAYACLIMRIDAPAYGAAYQYPGNRAAYGGCSFAIAFADLVTGDAAKDATEDSGAGSGVAAIHRRLRR